MVDGLASEKLFIFEPSDPQLFRQGLSLVVQGLVRIFGPLSGDLVEFMAEGFISFVRFLASLLLALFRILAIDHGSVLELVLTLATQLLDEMVWRDLLLEVVGILSEGDFGPDDRVEHRTEDLPDTLEDPGRVVNAQEVETFRVVCLETFDDVEYTFPVLTSGVSTMGGKVCQPTRGYATLRLAHHVRQPKSGHVKDEIDLVDGRCQEESVGLHGKEDVVFQCFRRLGKGLVHSDMDVDDGPSHSVGTEVVRLTRFHLHNESVGG